MSMYEAEILTEDAEYDADINGDTDEFDSEMYDNITLPNGLPRGGTEGQVLKKASSENYDTEWADEEGGNVQWEDISGIPETFPPSSHTHDDRYYTESEADALLSAKANTEDIPSLDGYATEQWVTDKHYLTDHQSLSAYRTATDQNTIDNAKADLVDGKIPQSQLPSYVDDVLSYNALSDFPATGEDGKIYITKDTNKTYRWSGTAYVEISPSIALGETASTAYRGDRGKTAYDHSQNSSVHVTAADKQAWNAKSDFSGAYADLTGKPPEFYVCVYGQTTLAEANAAHNAGKMLVCYEDQLAYMPMTAYDPAQIYFTGVYSDHVSGGIDSCEAYGYILSASGWESWAMPAIVQLSAGTGLTTSASGGGPITQSGTISLNAASIASLAKADTALQSHQSLAAYRTSSDQDTIDNGIKDLACQIININGGINADVKAKVTANPKAFLYHDNYIYTPIYISSDLPDYYFSFAPDENTGYCLLIDWTSLRIEQQFYSEYALISDLTSHTGNTTIHVTSSDKTTWNAKGTYSKPSGGIPKTDLESAVQTSLNRADTLTDIYINGLIDAKIDSAIGGEY